MLEEGWLQSLLTFEHPFSRNIQHTLRVGSRSVINELIGVKRLTDE